MECLIVELNVAKELKLAGIVSKAVIKERIAPLELLGRSIVMTEPVEVELKYFFDGEGFRLDGKLKTAIEMNCTKCDKRFVEPFAVDFSERFLRVSEAEAEELDCYTYTGDVLKLDKMVQDMILLNAPMYGLCKPDCKGLCPVCGTNLNITQCACSRNDESNPFAALKGLAELLKED